MEKERETHIQMYILQQYDFFSYRKKNDTKTFLQAVFALLMGVGRTRSYGNYCGNLRNIFQIILNIISQ